MNSCFMEQEIAYFIVIIILILTNIIQLLHFNKQFLLTLIVIKIMLILKITCFLVNIEINTQTNNGSRNISSC